MEATEIKNGKLTKNGFPEYKVHFLGGSLDINYKYYFII